MIVDIIIGIVCLLAGGFIGSYIGRGALKSKIAALEAEAKAKASALKSRVEAEMAHSAGPDTKPKA